MNPLIRYCPQCESWFTPAGDGLCPNCSSNKISRVIVFMWVCFCIACALIFAWLLLKQTTYL